MFIYMFTQKKVDMEKVWRETIEAADLVGDATVSPGKEGHGLQRQPDLGLVTSITGTPIKPTSQEIYSASPVFSNPTRKQASFAK